MVNVQKAQGHRLCKEHICEHVRDCHIYLEEKDHTVEDSEWTKSGQEKYYYTLTFTHRGELTLEGIAVDD